MSPLCEAFITAVVGRNWPMAYQSLDCLDMDEMLSGLGALDPADLADLWSQRHHLGFSVNRARIEFAHRVVHQGSLPASGSTQGAMDSSSVAEAGKWLAERNLLSFDHDLTLSLPGAGSAPRLKETDFEHAAQGAGLEVSAVMAVTQVEAGPLGGFSKGRPIIRYELHIFHDRTGGQYDLTHPHLSEPSWARGEGYHNKYQSNEYSLLHGAMILRDDGGQPRVEDACASASWGLFQVMGFNAHLAGWSNVMAFVRDMYHSEANHLKAFLGMVKSMHLKTALNGHDWATFARTYNGKGYKKNHYDQRMAAAYDKVSADRIARGLQP
ncbi:MAG TPA: N-acetylmuramidase family protein [Bryobacteraceae bacterium]|nr:N-acetylmuramidase family protein [Bryobacteraceae bacterium]